MKRKHNDEEWKEITFLGLHPDEKYQVSNYGSIRHFNKKMEQWKELATTNTQKDGSGYEYFTWFKGAPEYNPKISKPVHRLVAQNFCHKPDNDHEFVIHIDHNKSNNYFGNLRWATQREITAHSRTSPKVIKARGSNKGRITNSKLTETEVIRIKHKLKRGKTALYKIAKEFGITHTQLNRIRSGENWGHVKID